MQEAIVIERSPAGKSTSLEGISLQYLLIEKRLFEELVIFRPEGNRFGGIEWKLQQQQLVQRNNHWYDHFSVFVTAHREHDYNQLQDEWEANSNNDHFNRLEHLHKHEALKCWYVTDFWFDITSFYEEE
jgi:hypothetical protein